jgi:hypothetical protein
VKNFRLSLPVLHPALQAAEAERLRVQREREEEEARLARERRGVFAKAFAGASRVMGRLAASSKATQSPSPASPKVLVVLGFSSPMCVVCARAMCDGVVLLCRW